MAELLKSKQTVYRNKIRIKGIKKKELFLT